MDQDPQASSEAYPDNLHADQDPQVLSDANPDNRVTVN